MIKKVVLITGASSGLGLTIGQHLAKTGHTVYGTSRRESHDQGFPILQADVTDGNSVREAVTQILNRHGRLDVLINNAGLGIASPVESAQIEDVQRVFDTNVTGVIRMVQAALPQMRRQGFGLIINISSIGAEMGLPYRGIYSASKAAIERITEALRTELAPFGIQACSIQPGGVRTNINQNRLTAPLPEDNVYRESFETAYRIINKSVDEGLDADIFAALIEGLLQTKTVKPKYRVGKRLEHLSVLLKRILPPTMFENMIRKHYGLK
jgi:NAD(P)-dependent dehydrogenase (short-subunit alcohol dehydrogenase family)